MWRLHFYAIAAAQPVHESVCRPLIYAAMPVHAYRTACHLLWANLLLLPNYTERGSY